mgnify:CR=1 FL=1
MHPEIKTYNDNLSVEEREICNQLSVIIESELAEGESKLWHAHPVWFLAGNPIVGYSKQKAGIRLMFWSGADFEEEDLNVRGEKFKDASRFYNDVAEINPEDVKRWQQKSKAFNGIIKTL